ncbi:aminotransferase, class V [Oesophagostomum dentatum]|uniref:Aminotransferase, class V n=1 Tax=Oesophagostomum dentatum TaxID=61180 RepID=A0A0B1T0J8_OESDE|nr:aminotransferase, class V [Oesophagostomum dentatum]
MQRLFGERVPEIEGASSSKAPPISAELLPWIRKNEIGENAVTETPFGRRQVIYCDYTASARAIRPIEDYIVENVLPLYGNTHSSVTVTSEQTTLFIHEARQEIRAMTGAGDGDDVIFTGAGSTAAIELLIHLMKPEKLVVINSIHEHHSNLLPWRSIAEACYCVKEDENGTIDVDFPSNFFLGISFFSALIRESHALYIAQPPSQTVFLLVDDLLALQFLGALRESEGLDRTHLRRVGEYSSQEMLRPGFTRISIPYFWTDKQVDYLLDCIRFVSERAADFIHLYQLNCESAEWHHHKQRTFHARKWLGYVSFTKHGMVVEEKKVDILTKNPIAEAKRLADESLEMLEKVAERTKGIPVTYPRAPFRPRIYPCFDGKKDDLGEGMKDLYLEENKISNDVAECEFSADSDFIENGRDTDSKESCEPCSFGGTANTECPLEPAGGGNGRMGDFGTDENPSDAEMSDDWERRIVVTKRVLTPAEEAKLPWHKPPLDMYKREGDKILVCLSGGKDSLSLLHILHFYQMRCRKNKSTSFELGAITVDPGSSAYNPRPLIEYCRSLNIDYFYEEQGRYWLE